MTTAIFLILIGVLFLLAGLGVLTMNGVPVFFKTIGLLVPFFLIGYGAYLIRDIKKLKKWKEKYVNRD